MSVALDPLTAANVFSAWSLDPSAAVFVAVIAIAYLLGVWRTSRVRRWPVTRTLMFFLGLASFVVMTMSAIGTYDTVLFLPRAIQTVCLLMVTPLFLALGLPLTLLMRAVPARTAAWFRTAGHSRAAVTATFPAVISIALLATPFALFFTSWFTAVLTNPAANALTHFWLVGVGWAYYWTRLQIDPVPKVYPALVSMWITFTEVIFDGGLGLILMLGHNVIGIEHYQAVRDWGPSPVTDQQLGGAAFWIIGDLSGLPFLGALFRKMVSDDETRSAEIDRELDARAAEKAAARAAAKNAQMSTSAIGSTGAGPGGSLAVAQGSAADLDEPDDGMERPWWETDPSRLSS